jgi:hypothetical protein
MSYYPPSYQQPSPSYPQTIDWPFNLPADGIEHQVIQTDICRYLGRDARVRRGRDPEVSVFEDTELYLVGSRAKGLCVQYHRLAKKYTITMDTDRLLVFVSYPLVIVANMY